MENEKLVNSEKERLDREFEKCCEQYMPMVFAAIKRWRLDPDEYAQVGRIALFDAWRSYNPAVGPFTPYAKSYVLGRLKTSLHKQDRWKEMHSITEPVILVESAGVSKCEEVELLFLKEWLKSSGLSEREQLWVREGIFHQMKPGEIAEKHDVSVATVKDWRKRVLRKLKASANAVNGVGSCLPDVICHHATVDGFQGRGASNV